MLYHVTIASEGRLTLTRDEGGRRAAVRAWAALAGPALLLFSLVDDHLHAVLRALRARHLGRDMRRTLRRLEPEAELCAPHFKPVTDRSHLRHLVDYLVLQPLRHGLSVHPASWSGSCFQDLVGARRVPGYDLGALQAELPRLRLREVLATVGLEASPLVPADDDALRRVGAARLAELAAGALGVGPTLCDRSRPVTEARALAAQLARRIGFSSADMARFLGVTPQAVRNLATWPVPASSELALRRRLTLEDRVAAAPGAAFQKRGRDEGATLRR